MKYPVFGFHLENEFSSVEKHGKTTIQTYEQKKKIFM